MPRITLAAALALGAALVAGPAAGERIRIPGTAITVDAPQGFTLSQRFPGVESQASGASILVNQIPAPIDQMTAGFTAENLASRGMTLEGTETVTIGGRSARLYRLTQATQGAVFEKWLAAVGDASASVLVVGTFPQAAPEGVSAIVRTAVLSTRFGPPPSDRFEGLRYRVTAPQGLEIQNRLQNMLLLAAPKGSIEDGPQAPIAVVGSSHSPVRIDDLAAFARQRLARTAQVRDIKEVDGRSVQVAGRPGFVLTALAADKDSGTAMAVYQMVVLDGNDYYITQGLVGADHAESYLPRFHELATSMTLQ